MSCDSILVSFDNSLITHFFEQGTEMHQFVDIFAIPEISLIAQAIEFFRNNGIEYDPEYVFWDVRVSCVAGTVRMLL